MNKKDKEELLKEIDRRLKVLRDEFIASLDDKKEFELTYPENNETLYYFEIFEGEIYDTYYSDNSKVDKYIFEHGLYFNSKEEAKRYIKERKLLFKLHQWAKEKNGDWKPDWSNDDEEKYYITYFEDESIELSWEITWGMINFSKLPYFKTHELVRECIDLFGDEIKEVLA